MERIRLPKLCECGCGEVVKPGKRFAHGHNFKTKAGREFLASLCLGKTLPEETKAKISAALKGRKPWNTGLKLPDDAVRGFLGKHHTEETKLNMSKTRRGVKQSQEHILNRITQRMKPIADGYCGAWYDREYRDDVRGFACSYCGITNMMSMHLFGQLLCNHHMDAKTKCAPGDLDTLCVSCHVKLHRRAA